MQSAPTAPFRFTIVDALLAALVTLAGAAVRLYALQLVPTLTDETDEIQFALRIAGGGFAPAVSVDTYNGPLHHYLMAAGLALGGGAAWPRSLVMLLGALTVGLTYLLGASLAAQLGDRRGAGRATTRVAPMARLAGVIAAALMAVSFVPVVVNSHIAWSNATTPFWTTLTLVILSEAKRQGRPGLLIAAGIAAGLAVQTHPTAVIPLLGAALWVAVTRPGWLRTRWPWLALGAALLMVSNLILYNVFTAGGSAEGAARRDYAFTGGVSLAEYLANVQGFVGMAYQMVGSTFISTLGGDAAAAMRSPAVILYAVIAVVAVVSTARRAGLPLACWLAALIVLPVINRAYDSHISARYMAPLLPPTFAAMGALLAAGVAMLRGGWARVAVAVGAAAVTVLLVAYPAARLSSYYTYELADGRNNARLWQLVDAVRGPAQSGVPVWLDRGLRDARLDAGGHVYKALGTLLDLERIPHQNPRLEELPTATEGALLVLTDAQRDALTTLLRLTPVDVGAPPLPAAPGGYWLYRVGPH